MPKYDYYCKECNRQVLDFVKPMASDEVPQCCDKDMQQIYQATPVKFNGSGFYSTGG